MKKIFLALVVLISLMGPAHARPEKLDFADFSLIPVLHEGRVKPLDTYARIMLREFSGKDKIKNMEATEWLAQVLFDPATAATIPVFNVLQPVRDHLGLPHDSKLFAFDVIGPALHEHFNEFESLTAADPQALTAEQNDMLRLYNDAQKFSSLLRSFSFALPLNVTSPKGFETGKEENAYLDFLPIQPEMQKALKAVVRKKGANLEKYNDREKELAAFVYALEEIRAAGAANVELKIVPDSHNWLTPWELLLQKNISIDTWQAMAQAYRSNDAAAWKQSVKAARDLSPRTFRLKLEKAYNASEPFRSAMGFYILGMIILGAEIYRRSNRLLFPLICLGGGLACHAAGILSRMYILGRPPVGTLYESLLFVSLVCAGLGLALFLRRKNYSAYFAACGSAAFLLFIAPFLLQKGESMEMLVAVLNTGFWLGTHVLCITAGYAVSILTALFAHAWLFMRWKGAPVDILMPLQNRIYKISLAALLLTAVGTVLGGIWADQSWGRFWGWDPKENGALLIVLWIIWMQHGRVSGHLKPLAFTVTAAFLNVVVALAWFGVNLLSVGLHSYGFISGIAWALAVFCTAEIILIATLWKFNADKSARALMD